MLPVAGEYAPAALVSSPPRITEPAGPGSTYCASNRGCYRLVSGLLSKDRRLGFDVQFGFLAETRFGEAMRAHIWANKDGALQSQFGCETRES